MMKCLLDRVDLCSHKPVCKQKMSEESQQIRRLFLVAQDIQTRWRLRNRGCSQQGKIQCSLHLPPPFLIPTPFLLHTNPQRNFLHTIHKSNSDLLKVLSAYFCVCMYICLGCCGFFFLSSKSHGLFSLRHLEETRACIRSIISLEGYVQ